MDIRQAREKIDALKGGFPPRDGETWQDYLNRALDDTAIDHAEHTALSDLCEAMHCFGDVVPWDNSEIARLRHGLRQEDLELVDEVDETFKEWGYMSDQGNRDEAEEAETKYKRAMARLLRRLQK